MTVVQTPAFRSIECNTHKQRIKDCYDEIAVAYNQWTMLSYDYRVEYLNRLYDNFPELRCEQASVLELGCGSGQPVLEMLLENNPKLTAIGNDLSDTQLRLAEKRLSRYKDRLKLVQADMATLDFEEGTLSAVICLYAIIHLPSAEQTEMIAKIHSWLKPGGRILINFEPNPVEGEIWGQWLDDKGRLLQYGPGRTAMVQAMRQNGYDIDLELLQGSKETGEKTYIWMIGRKR